MSQNPSQPEQDLSPEEVIFDANLQEFAIRIALTCGLESNGKISPEEAYKRIKDLYKELKKSKKNLLTKPELDEDDSSDPGYGECA